MSDKDAIDRGEPAHCRICERVFRRVRLSWRYCAECGESFCEGEARKFRCPRAGALPHLLAAAELVSDLLT